MGVTGNMMVFLVYTSKDHSISLTIGTTQTMFLVKKAQYTDDQVNIMSFAC